ncbi:hypothetical protein [Streptomyces sp. NPDC059176]|uniref:hypothetical protein n=1 Tax=Streptomyces sp. NPDC059176 TaxID=3346758 RepID=UPI003683600C
MITAAGFATIAGTATLAAVTDVGKAQAMNASAVADGKGITPSVPDRAAAPRGGSDDGDRDGNSSAEQAGDPGWGGSGDEQGGHEDGASRQGQDEHGDSRGAGSKATFVDCDPNDLIGAITRANSDGGGTLTLAEKCTYTLTANQDGNGLPEIVQPITIHGNGSTIARAANADMFRIFRVAAGGNLKLRHLTLTRAKANGVEDGGAIYVEAAGRLDLDHTTLHNNTVGNIGFGDGGAIYSEGIVKISNSTISKNSGYDGGAINNEGGRLEVSTTRFTGNLSDGYGGTIYNGSGTATVGKSLFSYNSASDEYAGAIYVNSGHVDVEKSAFKYNYAYYGGALYHYNGGLDIRKSTIAYNTGSRQGGGLALWGSTVVEDSKIYDNTITDGYGGGIYINLDFGEEVAIRRTKISGNQAPGDGTSGGGIYIENDDEVTLTDVKVTDNTSDEEAGGIDNNGTVTTHGKIKIVDNVPTNCEGSANEVPNCFG